MIVHLVRRLVGKKPPAPQFSFDELGGLFAAMKEAEIEAVTAGEFARRFRRRRVASRAGFGVLRFDIHGNIERPLRVAERLAELNMQGLFMTMHRHTVNEAIYDLPATWDALTRIAELGHEIGLHFDPFYLIRAYGDLYAGIGAAAGELRQRGFTIEAASVHGDTRAHIKACGLQANDFFAEGFRQTRWNGEPPKGETFLADHVKRYSQTKIAEDYGIAYFAEPNFTKKGELVNEETPVYLSDNRRALRINNLPGENGNDGVLVGHEPFRIPLDFSYEVAAALKTRPFLALLHPQWYA